MPHVETLYSDVATMTLSGTARGKHVDTIHIDINRATSTFGAERIAGIAFTTRDPERLIESIEHACKRARRALGLDNNSREKEQEKEATEMRHRGYKLQPEENNSKEGQK